MNYRDYYEILNVSKTATKDEIRKAFRKLARKYHPDVAENKDTAEEKFKELNEAYEVLGDPEKRKKYDTLGKDWDKPGAGFQQSRPQGGAYEQRYSGTGFSDFFEQMFGAGTRPGEGGFHSFGGDPRGRSTPAQGQDSHADILVKLEEVMNGTERTLKLQQVNRATGQTELKTSKIRIPKGINQGQLIRCAGLGNPGRSGGKAGDLFLHVRLERHPDFRVIGSDLYYELLLAPWEAVLGAEVTVKSLGGEVRIKIPPLTEPATELRLQGRGLPTGSGDAMGDLYAVVHIAIPENVSKEEKTAWENLAQKSSFNPRLAPH